MCTDPNVKIKGLKDNEDQKKAEIIYSKGIYYSKEQEKILDQFFEEEKEVKRIKRENILAEFRKLENGLY